MLELAQRSHISHKKTHTFHTHIHIERERESRALRTTAFIRAKNYTVFGRRENAGNKIKITLFTQLALIQYLNQLISLKTQVSVLFSRAFFFSFSQTKQRNRKNSILFHIYTHIIHVTERAREKWTWYSWMLRRRSCCCCHLPAMERERETSLFTNPLTIFPKVSEDPRERERGGGDRVKNQILKCGRETDPSLPWNNILLLSSFSLLSEFSF